MPHLQAHTALGRGSISLIVLRYEGEVSGSVPHLQVHIASERGSILLIVLHREATTLIRLEKPTIIRLVL